MMAHKHLHELLKEDQEPFLLNKYISDRRSQMKKKRPSSTTTLQLKKPKPKPIYHPSNFPSHFCKNACFLSFPLQNTTPDNLLKSPLMEFASPANHCKSPSNKSPNAIFLHIPTRTASLLLEAALRIHKHSSPTKKPKSHNPTNAFGVFGSFFKRLTHRNRKREIQTEEKKQQGIVCERSSSAVWSETETNEDKSLDTETSSSSLCLSYESDEIDFLSKRNKHLNRCTCCLDDDDTFCESPFRFVLRRSPSSGRRTPELASPASSSRRRTEDKSKNTSEIIEKFQSGEEEEEKEQCSPVSVLDPPFEDDEDGHENDDVDDGFDLECSYAIVQRAKQQLLYKLRSFEKLAGLDPTELEKRMLEEDFDNDDELNWLVSQVLNQSSFHERRQTTPQDLKRLVSDLMIEEERQVINCVENREMVIRRVCERLELWKEVECNTIDMMVEEDFCRENGKWKNNDEHIKEVAGEVELAIFGLLVEEFSEELIC